MERRKVKNGEKSPWGQCLTDQFQTVAAVLASDWCQKNTSFLLPIFANLFRDYFLNLFFPLACFFLIWCSFFVLLSHGLLTGKLSRNKE